MAALENIGVFRVSCLVRAAQSKIYWNIQRNSFQIQTVSRLEVLNAFARRMILGEKM